MVKYCIFLLGIFSSIPGVAQNLEFGEASKLSSGINTESEDLMPLLSPDGSTLYFARVLSSLNTGGQYAGSDAWFSRYDAATGAWSKADNKLKINSNNTEAVIGINAKGDILYLLSTSATKKTQGIFFSRKQGAVWSKPELIPVQGLDSQQFLGIFVSPDADVIFISMRGEDAIGEEDLYVSVKNNKGEWSAPKNLGPTINTSGFEISPYLSQDKKRLYFSSNGHGGLGDADIFVSDRLFDSWEAWSVPKNVEKINSKNFDAYFSLYGDSVAYFVSNRSGSSADIYSVKRIKPVREVLTDSRNYLSKAEVQKLVGAVTTVYNFTLASSTLSEKQNQQLMQLAQAFAPKSEIKLHLIAHKSKESTSLEIYQKRLFTILDQLKRGGIAGARITFGIDQNDATSISEEGQVDILFYR